MPKNILFVTLIVALAGVLRLYDLGRTPSGLTADEASAGYNALSLLHTGRDRLGDPSVASTTVRSA